MLVGWLGLLGWGSAVRVGGESKNRTLTVSQKWDSNGLHATQASRRCASLI